MDILARGNDALKVNPITSVDESLTVHGSDWLWAVTAIYCFALVGCLVMSFAAKESERVFHYLFTFSLLVDSITYYAQASDLGWSGLRQVDNLGNGVIRQVFWVKYANWMLAFPSVTLALGLISGVSWTTIICNIFLSLFWVVSYLAGPMWLLLTSWTNLLWIVYPVAWGLTDGGNKICVTGGSIFFGVLDTLMVPVLSAAFLFFSPNWNHRKLSIAFSDSRPSRETEAAGLLKDNAQGPA
ncbi:family A G protein-coupled receptor-like protein [Aspergillus terreus]|uniref:Family A G protein-coupled receptor-like protein n=1 Tax=Aspergillus terreus TaxID=33178 RepID=A0A5M3ZC80_ASPTE|nr:hypothetical protein ATETN484_0011027000 [Aspergillus terreus]GFF18907.1 family A G protein-coupled receptor-like protein [Aspergillus terreus]